MIAPIGEKMRKAILLLCLCLCGLAAPAQQPAPDLVLLNAKVFTSNAGQPHAEAVAVRGERIVAVGTSKEIAALAGPYTKSLDAGGRVIIPGINDAHYHINIDPEHYELPIESLDPHWDEITAGISKAITKVPKGRWIRGVIGVSVLEDPQATRAALDKIAPNNPVMLYVWTGHASILNTPALAKLHISEDQPNPEGGQYIRSRTDGKLTGLVFEYSEFRAARDYSELATDQQAHQQLSEFFTQAAQWGITSVQNMSLPLTQQRTTLLFAIRPPPIRVRSIWFGYTDQHGRLANEGHSQPVPQAPLLTVSGIKWILDGTPVEHSSALRQPYADRHNTSGEMDFTEKEMEDILRESLRSNQQLMVHIVGDRTSEAFLNAMDATGGKRVWAARRVRIEHGEGITPDLVARARDLGVIIVQNPTHLALPDLMAKRYGVERMNQLQPLRSILDAGIPLAIGSDGPDNPYLNIMLATIDPDRPKEAITREQAVTAYTLTSAFAEFAEKEKGSIEPGKLADLAVLSQDIFTVPLPDLPKTLSLLTLVGGKVVYDAKVLNTQ